MISAISITTGNTVLLCRRTEGGMQANYRSCQYLTDKRRELMVTKLLVADRVCAAPDLAKGHRRLVPQIWCRRNWVRLLSGTVVSFLDHNIENDRYAYRRTQIKNLVHDLVLFIARHRNWECRLVVDADEVFWRLPESEHQTNLKLHGGTYPPCVQ